MKRVSLFIFICASFLYTSIFAAHAQTDQNASIIQLTVLNPVSTTTYSISLIRNGTGSGTITSADGNIICGSMCFETNIPNASSTVLTAVADPGSTFIGWTIGGGFMQQLGLVDFSGAAAIHIVAGFSSFFAAAILKPRIGRKEPLAIKKGGLSKEIVL